MTHAKDYISARTQHAKDSMPGLKQELEKLIDDSKAEFIDNGKIAITDEGLSEALSKFCAQDQELRQELCNWLEEFGWALCYEMNDEAHSRNMSPHYPIRKNYLLIPSAYRK